MNTIEGLINIIDGLQSRLSKLEFRSSPQWVYLSSPLTSVNWDGDSYSTTAKTKIDLSAVFSAPAGIKAILVRLAALDSGSAAGNSIWVMLSPNDTATVGALWVVMDGTPDDHINEDNGIVPCDANGDIYYQIVASGANTMDIWIQIWGYMV